MKFKLKTGEVMEGRPNGEEKPACFVFNLLDEVGREFNLTYKLPQVRFSENEVDAALDSVIASFKAWARKKLVQYEESVSAAEEGECLCENGDSSKCTIHKINE